MAKKRIYSVSLDPDIAARAKQMADDQFRSFSAFVEHVIGFYEAFTPDDEYELSEEAQEAQRIDDRLRREGERRGLGSDGKDPRLALRFRIRRMEEALTNQPVSMRFEEESAVLKRWLTLLEAEDLSD